ncbi:TPA: glycosyltransferase [Candidatus Woesearchaeota archaeon]|nr:glycosyltransferase [Candidatus Woesearchaeota archaeon]
MNERQAVSALICGIRRLGIRRAKICVVDGPSSDGTAKAAKRAGARVFRIRERGKAAAIRAAQQRIPGSSIVMMDADGSYSPSDIPLFLSCLGKNDVCIGSRFLGRMAKGSMSPINKAGNAALTRLANLLFGGDISDVCSGMWAFRRSAFRRMEINAKGFELEANFYVQCKKLRLKLAEVPISYGVRKGNSKLRLSDGIKIGIYLILERFGLKR